MGVRSGQPWSARFPAFREGLIVGKCLNHPGGANMYHVKELLGHENLNTLRDYVTLTIHDLKKTHEKCHPRERETAAHDRG